jgi:multidrug resistance efflux pump
MVFLILISLIAYSFWAKKEMLVITSLTLQKESVIVESIGSGQVIDIRVTANHNVSVNDLLIRVQEKIRAIKDTELETFESRIYELEKERDKLRDEYNYNLAQLQLELEDLKQRRAIKKVALNGRIAQLNEKLKTAKREKDLREKEHQTSLSRFQRAKRRYENRDITITQYEVAEQDMDRREKAVSDANARISELTVALRTTNNELATLTDLHGLDKVKQKIKQLEYRRDREVDRVNKSIDTILDKKAKSQRLVDGVSFKETVTEYRSIYDGLVTQIHVKKGQIITSGSPMVTLLKDTAVLEGQLLVPNKDIGKIKIGQHVQLKYDAYPYQEYGIQTGVVSDIAKRPVEINGQESMYLVKIALEKETISLRDSKKDHPLELGLEGTAEIKFGEKRWVEIIFTPISRFFKQVDE